MSDTIKILFAGGCQVAGYPVGEEHGFPTLVGNLLTAAGLPVEVHSLPYLKLAHRRRLTTKCREVRPDVLVMQLGHAELNGTLSAYLRSRWKFGKQSSRSEDSTIAAQELNSLLRFYCRAGLRQLVDTCLGHPLVDLPKLEGRWKALLADMKDQTIPVIVMLSPLPAADPTTMFYRRRALPLFRQIAEDYQCVFIDVLSPAPRGLQKSLGRTDYQFDGIHMGRAGHAAVSQLIAARLLMELSKATFQGQCRGSH